MSVPAGLIIDSSLATVKWLSDLLTKAGFVIQAAHTGREGLEKINRDRPDLVVLDLDLPDMDGVAVCKQIRANPDYDATRIMVLTSRDDPTLITTVLDLGVDEYIIKRPGADRELLGKCTSLLGRIKQGSQPLSTGRTITFFSAKGGNGTSTLCVNLANMLVQEVAPKTMLVVDMALPMGSLSLITGVHRDSSIVKLLAETQSFDPVSLGPYCAYLEPWDLSVLPSPRNPGEAQELDARRLEPLFNALTLTFNYVVVDLGRTLSRISLPILQRSNTIVVILGPDLVTVELSRVALKYLAETGISTARFFPILNRAVGREGLTKAQIEETLGLSIQGTIPNTQDNFTLSNNQALPYARCFPFDTTTTMLKELARQLRYHIEGK
jgi:pilus assembly protein CpaE